ncbi:hypothetical protein CTEN210_11615 [Chaetoceros tenuissimus]|uniref:RING-type domain-containing protein n=1 Tax=Chaetoceros tenuissimus TaxID=426638 RepID=A0AAD3D2Y1_9STRA|nr:hypothetical protein CTEN210_11615 [Chaetoceros tenuissimus]
MFIYPDGNTSKDTENEVLPKEIGNQPSTEHGYLWELVLMALVVFALFLTCYLCALWNQNRTEVRQLEDMKSQLKITKFINIALHHHLQDMDIEALQEHSTTLSSSQENDFGPETKFPEEEVLRDKQDRENERKEELDKDTDSTIVTVSISSEDDWKYSCAICYEHFNNEVDIASSANDSCHHYYHVDCILSWLIIDSNHHTCPICRDTFVDSVDQKAMYNV